MKCSGEEITRLVARCPLKGQRIYIYIYVYIYIYIYTYSFTCLFMRYGLYFWSRVSALDFGEWGIVFHVLALCLVQNTEAMRSKEYLQLPARFS